MIEVRNQDAVKIVLKIFNKHDSVLQVAETIVFFAHFQCSNISYHTQSWWYVRALHFFRCTVPHSILYLGLPNDLGGSRLGFEDGRHPKIFWIAPSLHRLQSVQNAAARLIFTARRQDHVQLLLHSLHWLRAVAAPALGIHQVLARS